jgi:nucleoside-diphosphate-sugar epimerase
MDSSSYGQVIPEFIRKISSPETFALIGNGEQTRSFCYVSDLIYQIVESTTRISRTVLNVGADREVTILELARLLHSLTDRPFDPAFLPPRSGDHHRRRPCLARMRAQVPSMPAVTLEEGLLETLRHSLISRDRFERGIAG